MNLNELKDHPRLLLEVSLKPLQGSRFQPTGFPDLGAAAYEAPGGVKMLLVESAQSMANRLESVCWDSVADDWVSPLKGLPAVKVVDKDKKPLTNSVLEAHRLNSVFIKRADGGKLHLELKAAITPKEDRPMCLKAVATALARYDVNALIHGVFLETIDGRARIPRALTSFIEASEVSVVASGGVKNDRVDPDKSISLPAALPGVKTEKDEDRQGNVPFHREEYTGTITAYFNLDLALIRGFGLSSDAEALLIALSLFKIQRFLRDGLRLRTACDLDAGTITIKRPSGFTLPGLEDLEKALPGLITKAFGGDKPDRFTTVTFEEGASKKPAKGKPAVEPATQDDA